MDLNLRSLTGVKFAVGSLQCEMRTLGDGFHFSDREVATTHNVERGPTVYNPCPHWRRRAAIALALVAPLNSGNDALQVNVRVGTDRKGKLRRSPPGDFPINNPNSVRLIAPTLSDSGNMVARSAFVTVGRTLQQSPSTRPGSRNHLGNDIFDDFLWLGMKSNLPPRGGNRTRDLRCTHHGRLLAVLPLLLRRGLARGGVGFVSLARHRSSGPCCTLGARGPTARLGPFVLL
jgi:hypothetical protein